MLLFLFFILTFAQCYQLLGVDASAYGRMNMLLAHIYSTLRSAMGDFSLINPYEGFDVCHNGKHPTDPHKCFNDEYVHSYSIVMFTWIIYILGVFFLTLIFMNFIISVIGTSYTIVTENQDAFDYKQKVDMIYEREMHFDEHDFDNELYFPKILIIRKRKLSNM